MIVFVVSMVGWFVLDLLAGGPDGDNPEVSLAFLRDHPRNTVIAGLLLWIMALSLVVVVTVVSDEMERHVASAQRRSATIVGYFSAGSFLLYGVLLVSTAGTLVYIDDLDNTWGEAAYLAVQIVGTQGLGAGGLLAFSIWAVWLGVANARAKVLNRAVTGMAAAPAALILMGMLGPLGIGPDVLYLVYVLAFVGLIPWCLVLGVSLIRAKTARLPM